MESDAEKIKSTDILFTTESDDFGRKCHSIGGQPVVLGGADICQIPNKSVNLNFGYNACEQKLKGTLFRSESLEICSLDSFAVDNALKLAQRGSYLYSIGTYTRFAAYLKTYVLANKMGTTTDKGMVAPIFLDTITNNMRDSHLFEITDDLKRLLVLTSTPKVNDAVHLPFSTIFIDVNFKRDEMLNLGVDIGYDEIVGIMLTEAKLIRYGGEGERMLMTTSDLAEKKSYGSALRITILGLHNEEMQFDVYNRNFNLTDEAKELAARGRTTIEKIDMTDPRARKFAHHFALNFLNFLQDPEVSYHEVAYDAEKNKRRMKEGKFPIPPRNMIYLDGTLKKYVKQLREDPRTWTYSHRFWVMGHYRTLQSPRYGSNVGRRFYVFPFIKGKGALIQRSYMVDTPRDDE